MTADRAPLVLGTATSSYQIEGAVTADGRGPSIWDTFCARPGAIRDGSDGRVACGSYERLGEDLDLLDQLGAGAYRFSVAWPRVIPDGTGAVEPRGLDYYERLVDGLLERGIDPIPTLYHWDLPQPLEDAGGWPVRATAERFGDYAAAVADRLADRVVRWATLNEPWCSAFLGYAAGVHAPGRREPAAAYAAAHHLLLGHGLAAEALQAARADAEVGIVLNLTVVELEPGADPDAADFVDAVANRLWLDALLDGCYPVRLTDADGPSSVLAGELARPSDLAGLRARTDWLGVNYYTTSRVAPRDGRPGVGQDTAAFPGAPPLSFAPREPRTSMGWEIAPDALERLLRFLGERAPGLPLRVTENGAAFPDERVADDGTVEDEDRVAFLRDHLAAVDRARGAGVDVRAYLAWSLMDNFEWAEGYRMTFGIAGVEPGTLRRVPKRSFWWYRDEIRRRETG